MSFKVANACSDRLFGSPVRKQIIMFLADKASDDGSGVYCSKGYIARHTELGGSTVKRVVSEFVAEGILVETGSRRCTNGYTIVYRIDLATVELLDPVKVVEHETPSRPNQARNGPGTGSATDRVPRPQRDPNHPKTIHKPPTRRREAVEEAEDIEFDNILAAYPEDRIRNRRTCLDQISTAVREGVEPDDLSTVIKAYAAKTKGYTRRTICFSDNWFKMRRWEKGLVQIQADREKAQEAEVKSRASLASWIHERHPLCRHITSCQLDNLLAEKLVTPDQVRAAGLLM